MRKRPYKVHLRWFRNSKLVDKEYENYRYQVWHNGSVYELFCRLRSPHKSTREWILVQLKPKTMDFSRHIAHKKGPPRVFVPEQAQEWAEKFIIGDLERLAIETRDLVGKTKENPAKKKHMDEAEESEGAKEAEAWVRAHYYHARFVAYHARVVAFNGTEVTHGKQTVHKFIVVGRDDPNLFWEVAVYPRPYVPGTWNIAYRRTLGELEALAFMTKTKENPMRRTRRARPNRLKLVPRPAHFNPRTPGGAEVYDPREEQLRAQRQAIYESQLKRAMGLESSAPFRDGRGIRLDASIPPDEIRPFVSKCMFAMGTSVQQRDGRLKKGTQQFKPKTAYESAARMQDVDHLLRNRQDYEETLGLARKSDFYRVTMEPVSHGKSGFGWFVWPLAPGVQAPQLYLTEYAAQAQAQRLSAMADPRNTGVWWTPLRRRYRASELAHWLPPVEVLQPGYDLAKRAETRRGRRKAGSNS